jgi:hypothetical protein
LKYVRLVIMIKIKSVILLGMASVLFSCTEKLRENQNTISSLANENAQNEILTAGPLGKIRMERKIKGDTLAINYKDLQKYLPEEINGYTVVNIPEGESVDIPGMSFSLAEKVYKKGESELTISLYDYNGAYDMYEGATSLFTSGLPVKNENETAHGMLVKKNIKGWESFKKKDKRAELMLGIAERFYLNIKADKQDGTDVIKNVANKLNLDALNNL